MSFSILIFETRHFEIYQTYIFHLAFEIFITSNSSKALRITNCIRTEKSNLGLEFSETLFKLENFLGIYKYDFYSSSFLSKKPHIRGNSFQCNLLHFAFTQYACSNSACEMYVQNHLASIQKFQLSSFMYFKTF